MTYNHTTQQILGRIRLRSQESSYIVSTCSTQISNVYPRGLSGRNANVEANRDFGRNSNTGLITFVGALLVTYENDIYLTHGFVCFFVLFVSSCPLLFGWKKYITPAVPTLAIIEETTIALVE